jgi:hypothetical protein
VENFRWINESGLERRLPEGSRNGRYYCKSCQTYVGEDATRPLGVYAFPLHRVKGPVADQYKPNHHIFYANRVADCNDSIPKWQTLPEGTLVDTAADRKSETAASNLPPGGLQWDASRGMALRSACALATLISLVHVSDCGVDCC